MNLAWPWQAVPLPTPDESSESVASILELPELLGIIYDATAAAPGAHENDIKCDSF